MMGPFGRQGPAATLRQQCPQMTRRRCTYRVFPGQGEAIAFANSENGRDANNATTCSVFAAELDRSGRRQFIVCHREKMWSVVQELRPDRQVDFSE